MSTHCLGLKPVYPASEGLKFGGLFRRLGLNFLQSYPDKGRGLEVRLATSPLNIYMLCNPRKMKPNGLNDGDLENGKRLKN
jgi:hypothetical protein